MGEENVESRWLILDGPIDAIWVENMNTALNNIKQLTLVNGDRIQIMPNMRLLFEVADLAVASPSIVSMNGMVYMDTDGIGW
jgi:dynein heavy chain